MNHETSLIYIFSSATTTRTGCVINLKSNTHWFTVTLPCQFYSVLKLKGGYFSSAYGTISSGLVRWWPVTWLGSRVNWLSLRPPVNYKQTGEISYLSFPFLLILYPSDFLSHSLSLWGAPSGSSRLSSVQCGPLSLSSGQPRQSPDALMQAELALFREREHQSSRRKCVLYYQPVWVNMTDERRQASQGVDGTNKQSH